MPADVVDRLRKRLKGEMDENIAELRQTVDKLAGGTALGESAFNALDSVCEAADATASAAFRRLRRI